MKKLIICVCLLFALTLCSCKEGSRSETTTLSTTTQSQAKLYISYYDGDMMIMKKSYLKDGFKLETYEKEDYEFKGWYLDYELTTPFDLDSLDSYFETKRMDVFAKMERTIKNLNIECIGQVDGKSVLNPAFTWKNENFDESFEITVTKNGLEILKTTVTGTSYEMAKFLDISSKYTIEIRGLNSGSTGTTEISTVGRNAASLAIKVSNPFMDNMVIQRNQEILIKGTGPKEQLITVSFNDVKAYGVSDASGNFEINVPSQEASFDPTVITITNSVDKTVSIKNVLFGDVYLFTGQSNMQWQAQNSDYEMSDVVNAMESDIRYFCQDVRTSSTELDYVSGGHWFNIDTASYRTLSAIAFMAGSMLSTALKNSVPIGILTAYQGDTNIANWMNNEYYQGSCASKYLHYNAMIAPLTSARISGVVWYQGCNNSAQGGEYKELLLKYFENYRDIFNNDSLPFYVIGLACYDGDSGNNYDFSYVRESQVNACQEDDKAYFISICDNGDPTYIHPSVKRYVADRISKSIQGTIYGKKTMVEGPIYKSHTVEGNKVTIEFYNSVGLWAKGEIKGMYLAGTDGKYYPAKASVSNGTVIATSEYVENPVYIKYGFSKSPFVNIFNKDGFAVAPFRTDSLNTNIDMLDYVSTEPYTFHPSGSTMDISVSNGILNIAKQNDGKTYGSVRLDKWGMIAYNPEGLRITVTGTNSGATISFRMIEGSYETWGYKFKDDFTGEKTFTINMGDLEVLYNKKDAIFDSQKINYIEIMIESSSSASISVSEFRFVEVEKTAPASFSILSVNEMEDKVAVTIGKSVFADKYRVIVSSSGSDLENPIFDQVSEDNIFYIDKSLLKVGNPYYIFSEAINDLGKKGANNDGYVFYLKDDSKVIICNFDFATDEALQSYLGSNSMDIHKGLTCSLADRGVRIESGGEGWMQFIFKIESGSADGMKKLTFYADFSNYKGKVIMQLADTYWSVYQYEIDLSVQNKGEFTIDFSSFKKEGSSFKTTLMWIMFNFSDSVGNGYIILDDVNLTK